MKKLDMTNYKPTELTIPRIGSDDPNEREKLCATCQGWIAVVGRIYCVTGIKWCACPTPSPMERKECGNCCPDCEKKEECIACKYSGVDEQMYAAHGCPACTCKERG